MALRKSTLGPLMRDLHRLTILPRDEQIALALAAQAGDVGARNRLIESVLPFALKQAQRYQRGRSQMLLELGDLFQSTFAELCRAIDNFDPSRGAAFISYAGWWIRNAFQKAARHNRSIVRIPGHAQQCVADGRDDYLALVGKVLKPISIDQPRQEDDEPRLVPSLSLTPEEQAIANEDEKLQRRKVLRVKKAIRKLPAAWKAVLLSRMAAESCEEIAQRMGITRERVRQIEVAALHRVRVTVGADPFAGESISKAFGYSTNGAKGKQRKRLLSQAV